MKVYIFTTEAFPYGMAATNRIKCYSKMIQSAGIECQIIIARRTEKYGIEPKNTKGKNLNCETPYLYIGGTPMRDSNVIKRKLHDLKDKSKLIDFIKNKIKSDDVIITYMRENPMCSLIIKYAHKVGAKVVRDLCELPYGTVKETRQIIRKRKEYFKKKFPLYDGAICISTPLYKLAEQYKSPSAKLIKIPILIDDHVWDFSEIKDKKLGHPFLFHSGTLHQQKDGIVNVLEAYGMAIQKLPNNLKYFFTGNLDQSINAPEIKDVIKKYKLEDRIEFLGFLSFDELKSFIFSSDGFIINKLSNKQNEYCFATKLGEYLLSGNPVITTKVGEAKHYLNNRESAIFVEEGDNEALSQSIIDLFEINNNLDLRRIGQQGKNVAMNNFTINKQKRILQEYLEKL